MVGELVAVQQPPLIDEGFQRRWQGQLPAENTVQSG